MYTECVLHDFWICHHFPKQAFTLIWIYVLNKITVGDPFNRNQNPCSNSPTKTLHNNESHFERLMRKKNPSSNLPNIYYKYKIFLSSEFEFWKALQRRSRKYIVLFMIIKCVKIWMWFFFSRQTCAECSPHLLHNIIRVVLSRLCDKTSFYYSRWEEL